MTCATWLIDWLNLRKAELKPRTIEQYQDLMTRFVFPALGAVDVDALQADQLRHLLADIAGSGHSRTAELVYVMLKAAFRDLAHDPMRKVRRPAHVQRSPIAWSDDQIAVYMSALADHRHGLALSLGIVLGLRRGEICGLRWGDIDFDQGEIHITNQRQRLASGQIVDQSPKSATSKRPIPVPAPLLAALRASRGVPAAYVCSLSPSGLDAAHRRLVRRLALPYTPLHGLRHTMATACIRHGGDMRALQALLGHASYTTTANRYTHPDRPMLAAAIDAAAVPCYNVIHM